MNIVKFSRWSGFVILVFQFGCCCQGDKVKCGTVNLVKSLVVGGDKADRLEWPFLVAVYKKSPYEFICGGTLLSHTHVLTGK